MEALAKTPRQIMQCRRDRKEDAVKQIARTNEQGREIEVS
jgi:hypothetical protein